MKDKISPNPATSLDKPQWIADKRWEAMSPHQRQVEVDAESILAGPHREFISHDTTLIRACLEKGVMQEAHIRNYPQPKTWSIDECRTYCLENKNDFVSSVASMEPEILWLWLHRVIQFGLQEIPVDVLRKILHGLATGDSEASIGLWRDIVHFMKPDIYEWWGINESLAEDFIQRREFVLMNEYGCWWGRTATGQHILMDGSLQQIAHMRLSNATTGG
jgi:hypothetical protein